MGNQEVSVGLEKTISIKFSMGALGVEVSGLPC